jgi:hypothetical protein
VGAQRLLLAAIGEPRRSRFAPGELRELLEQAGWSIVRAEERGYGGGDDGPRGFLVLAE